MEKLTQEELKSRLIYSPESGIFIWAVATGTRGRAGAIAGSRHNRGYWRIEVMGRKYLAHRLAYLYMAGSFPPDEIDHINGIRDDNRWVNLRAVSADENARNRRLSRNSTTGITGVYWAKLTRKWVAQIGVCGAQKTIGYFDSMGEAIRARREAEAIHGYHRNHGKKPSRKSPLQPHASCR